MKNHVSVLSHQIGWRGLDQYENLQKAADYIANSFAQTGLKVQRQEFLAQGKTVGNVAAEKKGSTYPQKVIIVGAHYDTYFNPGADSNASGVAALLELAEIFSKIETHATIRFVAFANKEPPFFATDEMGSLVYAKHLKEANEDIEAVIILDSIGYYSNISYSQHYPPFLGFFYPDKGNFLCLVGNMRSRALLQSLETVLKKDTSLVIAKVMGFDFINSDHWAFWRENFNTVLMTDTGSYRNPYINSLSDTYPKLNYLNMAQLVRGLAFALKALAD